MQAGGTDSHMQGYDIVVEDVDRQARGLQG